MMTLGEDLTWGMMTNDDLDFRDCKECADSGDLGG